MCARYISIRTPTNAIIPSYLDVWNSELTCNVHLKQYTQNAASVLFCRMNFKTAAPCFITGKSLLQLILSVLFHSHSDLVEISWMYRNRSKRVKVSVRVDYS